MKQLWKEKAGEGVGSLSGKERARAGKEGRKGFFKVFHDLPFYLKKSLEKLNKN
jgi:hypothetical protein